MSGLYILTSNLRYDLGEMNPLMSLEVIVWCLCGGLILGALGSYFTRRDASLLIRKLIEDEIFTPDRAITLEEAGLASNLPLRPHEPFHLSGTVQHGVIHIDVNDGRSILNLLCRYLQTFFIFALADQTRKFA